MESVIDTTYWMLVQWLTVWLVTVLVVLVVQSEMVMVNVTVHDTMQ